MGGKMSKVIYEVREKVGYITLNRPIKRTPSTWNLHPPCSTPLTTQRRTRRYG